MADESVVVMDQAERALNMALSQTAEAATEDDIYFMSTAANVCPSKIAELAKNLIQVRG